MIRTFVSFLGILMLLTMVMEPASAQVLYGSAVGMVEDQTGSSVSNATVTMTNKATGVVRTTNTGADGRFYFVQLTSRRLRSEGDCLRVQDTDQNRGGGHD